jgi:hypothetical protein
MRPHATLRVTPAWADDLDVGRRPDELTAPNYRRGKDGTVDARHDGWRTAMPDVDARLRELLDADPPESVTALPEAARAELAAVIAEAKARQRASLAESFDATLRHVPFPARRLVKKALLG